MPSNTFDYLQSEDNRVVITPLLEEYYEGLAKIAYPDKEYLERFEEPFWTEFHTTEIIAEKVKESKKSHADWHVILGRGVIVGAIYDQQLPLQESTTNIGYWVVSEHQSQGYASGAVRLLSDYVLANGESEVVIASPRVDNIPSRRVLEAANFTIQKVWRSKQTRHEHVTYEKRL